MSGPFELVTSVGDPQGIGPEIALFAARSFLGEHPECAVVLVGPEAPLRAAGAAGTELRPPAGPGLALLEVEAGPFLDPPPSIAGGRAALRALEVATARVREAPGSRALVTAPLSKSAVAAIEPGFLGHTGWLAQALAAEDPVMLFVAGCLRVALATVHIPLREVAWAIRADRLLALFRTLRRSLILDSGIPDPEILVLGLNPHAGEGGLLGAEEETVLRPAIQAFAAEGGRVRGPFPADSVFRAGRRPPGDAVVAMYHDQGLLPLKTLAGGAAVNVTLGLPIVRTSPDHGCAFDLAGTGRADPSSMLAALREAHARLAARAARDRG
jgi:4-hydroxythreonine-4-phosphate dehydrogenase